MTKIKPFNLFVCLQSSLTIVGAVVGAGFASGKEVQTFIGIYKYPLVISIIFGVLFYFGLKTLFWCTDLQLNKAQKLIINASIFISISISFTAMISALSQTLAGLTTWRFAGIFALILIYLIILFGLNGINKANLMLVPLLIIFIVFLGVFSIKNNTLTTNLITVNFKPFCIISLPLYLGMNLYSIYPINLELKKVLNKKEQNISCLISSILLGFLLICLLLCITYTTSNISNTELPTLTFVNVYLPKLYNIATIILSIAICTTLIADGFILNNLYKTKIKHNNILLLATFIIGYLISKLGFAFIVKYFYPISGSIGLLTLITIIILKLTKKSSRQ